LNSTFILLVKNFAKNAEHTLGGWFITFPRKGATFTQLCKLTVSIIFTNVITSR